MITFCFNDRAKAVDEDDFGLLLAVVEGQIDLGTGGGKRKELRPL
jgi:hypothetical protein